MSTFSFPLFDSFCAQTVCMFHARAEERVLTMLFFSAGAHYLSVMTLMSYVSRVCLPQKFKVGIDFLTTLRPGLRFIFFFFLHSAARESLYVGWGRQKTVQGFSCLAPRCELHLIFNKIIKKSDFLVLVQMCCSCQAETTTRPSQEKETSESERLTFRIRDADLLFLEL